MQPETLAHVEYVESTLTHCVGLIDPNRDWCGACRQAEDNETDYPATGHDKTCELWIVETARESLRALVVEVERLTAANTEHPYFALVTASRERAEKAEAEVGRLTAELEGLKSKLGGDKVASSGGEPERIVNPRDVPDAQAIIADLCQLQSEVTAARFGHELANDCFCGEGGYWPLRRAEYFRNERQSVNFIIDATRAALAAGDERRLPDPAPEDEVVISEVMRRLSNLVADLPARADGAVNGRDLYLALSDPASPLEGHETGPDKQAGDDTVVSDGSGTGAEVALVDHIPSHHTGELPCYIAINRQHYAVRSWFVTGARLREIGGVKADEDLWKVGVDGEDSKVREAESVHLLGGRFYTTPKFINGGNE